MCGCTYLTKGLFSHLFTTYYPSPSNILLSSPTQSCHSSPSHLVPPSCTLFRLQSPFRPFFHSNVFTSSASSSVQSHLMCLSRMRLQCQSSGSCIPCLVFRVLCFENDPFASGCLLTIYLLCPCLLITCAIFSPWSYRMKWFHASSLFLSS